MSRLQPGLPPIFRLEKEESTLREEDAITWQQAYRQFPVTPQKAPFPWEVSLMSAPRTEAFIADSAQSHEAFQAAELSTEETGDRVAVSLALSVEWLMDTLRTKLERVKTYPTSEKINHWKGCMVVQVRIEGDDRIANPEIEESVGHPALDRAALEALQAASPLMLAHDLDGRPVVMLVQLSTLSKLYV